ncbi:MAG TPA: polysaccharide deacetylase family protein [Candidatus Nitrosotalea sp.]|nr:polysaccharide deacetylase family protein [Candidatus Nitrosotalea sp.]
MRITGFKIKNKKTKFLALAMAFLLASNLASYFTSANAQTSDSTLDSGSCMCVVFRLDDVNSNLLATVQQSILEQFISENQSLSLGLIMHDIDPVSPVTEKIKEGKQKGLFELDLHGWDHVDYTQLSPEAQLGTLQQANAKMRIIFGQYSQVFIPPYNKFDGDTIGVLRPIGIKILSADTTSDKSSYFVSNENTRLSNDSLYHLPAVESFKNDNGNGTWTKVPISTLLYQIDSHVSRYGYAVVLLHPQNFAKIQDNVSVDAVDENEIRDLSSLIHSIESKNLKITTFAGVTGLNGIPAVSPVQTVPEFQTAGPIVFALSAIIGFVILRQNNLGHK